MDLMIDCEKSNIESCGSNKVRVTMTEIDTNDLRRALGDLVMNIGLDAVLSELDVSDVLDSIGRDAAMAHFIGIDRS